MAFPWIPAAVYAVSFLIEVLTRKPISRVENYQQNSSGRPSIEKGVPVPVIWGHAFITQPLVIYSGNYQFNSETDSFVYDGETYYTRITDPRCNAVIAFALCRGAMDSDNGDGLLFVRIGGKPPTDEVAGGSNWCRTTSDVGVAYPTVVTAGCSIKDRDLFGGKGQGGGVQLDGMIHFGADAESADSNFLTQTGLVAVPAWRNIVWFWMYNYVGKGPILPSYEFEIRRCPNNLSLDSSGYKIVDPDVANIYDANPAEMLYELLTDDDFGLGLTTDEVNQTSFQTAGNTLYTETLGMSLVWDGLSPVANVIEEILKTIGGVLYQDSNGKIAISLLRAADTSVLTIDEDNCITLEMDTQAWSDSIDNIIVEYPLRQTNTNRISRGSITANDPGRFQWGSNRVATKVQYEGIRRADIAEKLAVRDLRLLTSPTRKFRAVVNREGAIGSDDETITPGKVVLVTWTDYGISAVRCRVDTVDQGLLEDGKITFYLIEDFFDQTAAAFDSPETEWNDDDAEPDEVGYGYSYGNAYGGGV